LARAVFVANCWALVAGIPTKILNARLYDLVLPKNTLGLFRWYPFAAATGTLVWSLEFDIYLLFGSWCLELFTPIDFSCFLSDCPNSNFGDFAMRLKDKVALITGAGSGIGQAIAIRFAAEGAKVVVNYHRGGKHPGEAVVQEIAGQNGSSVAIAAEITQRAEVESMVQETVRKFSRLDIAICNAGVEIKKPFVDVTDAEWNKVIGVNLYGAFLVSQIAARQMVKQGQGGKLIFISSVHEDIPFAGYTAYCASKGALRMMMRNLALELADHKINCNNIAPGAISTPINQSVLDDPEAMKNALSEIPLGRFGKPEEVASVAVFLASTEADYVTGSTYYIDGGLVQQVTKY
jgi:glucose 1-dehydrogenase